MEEGGGIRKILGVGEGTKVVDQIKKTLSKN
jgi:hypothetical protein